MTLTGRMYGEDLRFSENIDGKAPGLARYLAEAIAAKRRAMIGISDSC